MSDDDEWGKWLEREARDGGGVIGWKPPRGHPGLIRGFLLMLVAAGIVLLVLNAVGVT